MGDIYVPPRQWVNAYTASGIPAGSGLLLQNKALMPVLVLEQAGQPAAGDPSGWLLQQGAAIEVDAGSPGVWIWSAPGDARVFAQEV